MADNLVRVFNREKNVVKYVTQTVARSGALEKQGFIIQSAPSAPSLNSTPAVTPKQVDLEESIEEVSNEAAVAPIDLGGLNTAESIEKLETATKEELIATLEVEKRKGVRKHIESLIEKQ